MCTDLCRKRDPFLDQLYASRKLARHKTGATFHKIYDVDTEHVARLLGHFFGLRILLEGELPATLLVVYDSAVMECRCLCIWILNFLRQLDAEIGEGQCFFEFTHVPE